MQSHAYWYFVPYESDVAAALTKLREREFQAGRYHPRMRRVDFDEAQLMGQAPGAGHTSIAKAVAATFDEGTRSILDVSRVAAEPTYGAVAPMSDAAMEAAFGTRRPTRGQVPADAGWLDPLERGQCWVVTIWDGEEARELLFAGITIG